MHYMKKQAWKTTILSILFFFPMFFGGLILALESNLFLGLAFVIIAICLACYGLLKVVEQEREQFRLPPEGTLRVFNKKVV